MAKYGKDITTTRKPTADMLGLRVRKAERHLDEAIKAGDLKAIAEAHKDVVKARDEYEDRLADDREAARDALDAWGSDDED